jgi:uncharacterized membrane protein
MFVFLWMLIMGLIIVLPFWKIFQKAGFNGVLAILMLVPFVNLFMIFYLAFTEWPVFKAKPPQQP